MMSFSRKQKFVSVGSSLAVVIPKHVCRLLELDRTTELELRLSDNVIVVRPIASADRVGQPDRDQLYRLLTTLVKTYELSTAHFARLSNDGRSFREFLNDVDIGGRVDTLTVARLAECLARRRDLGATQVEPWNETIDEILLRLPSPRTPQAEDSPSTGSPTPM